MTIVLYSKMKILFAIVSCWLCEVNGDNQSCRDTWLKDVPPNVDYKFFHGTGFSAYPGSDKKFSRADVDHIPYDVVVLNSPESYLNLIERAQELYYWAWSRGYDYVFKCYPDTWVDVKQLLHSGFEKHDFFGHWLTAPNTPCGDGTVNQYGCLGGGEGYWLSRRACELVIKAKPCVDPIGEDTWVGQIMGENGIQMVDHTGYGEGVTLHGSVRHRPIDYRPGQYDNSWMYKTYKELKG